MHTNGFGSPNGNIAVLFILLKKNFQKLSLRIEWNKNWVRIAQLSEIIGQYIDITFDH